MLQANKSKRKSENIETAYRLLSSTYMYRYIHLVKTVKLIISQDTYNNIHLIIQLLDQLIDQASV